MTEDEHRIAASPRESGLLIVHTGNGKGKTTAAMGLALRAVGQGFRVLMIQFVKGSRHYGELEAAKHLHPRFEILPLGRGMMRPFGREPGAKDREAAREAWEKGRSAIVSREYGMVILDEIHIALHRGLLPQAEVVAFLRERPRDVHLVLTGRWAPEEIIAEADLVTEMVEVRHPFQKGICAQKGIEF